MFRRILLAAFLLASPVSAQLGRRHLTKAIVPEIDPSGSREAIVLVIAALLLIAPAIRSRSSRSETAPPQT